MSRGGGRRRYALAVQIGAVAALGVLAIWLVCVAYRVLYGLWTAQCVVEDVKAQVTVRSSPHVKEDLVLELFGLKKGCNLSTMDLAGRREEILRTRPIVKSIAVRRRLPARLEIDVEERVPVARVNYSGKTRDKPYDSWDVADAEGVVFNFPLKDSRMLPRIVDAAGLPEIKRGERLSAKAMSALRLVELASRKDFPHISILDVNISNNTYLIAATSDYSLIKFDWEYVDDPFAPGQPHIEEALKNIEMMLSGDIPLPVRCTFFVAEAGRVSVLPYEKDISR